MEFLVDNQSELTDYATMGNEQNGEQKLSNDEINEDPFKPIYGSKQHRSKKRLRKARKRNRK